MIIKEYNFPNSEEIKISEKLANKDGSGIEFEDLVGFWKLQYVYQKGDLSIDNVSSSFLQILSASLELRKFTGQNDNPTYEISNSIKFGVLTVAFSGKAYLKGSRPLLIFYFEKILIKFLNISLINKSLKNIDSKKRPFFSLIALGEGRKWLCARGKGGGLAIWINS
tara:strand:- start:715 stop:1215 length:501 start_codon:yes stop_codon:yes gene_type:complete